MSNLTGNVRHATRAGWKISGLFAVGVLLISAHTTRAQDQDGNAGGPGIEEIRIHVDGLACPFCSFNIEKRLLRLEGVIGDDQIEVSIAEGIVSLEWDPEVVFDPEAVNEQVRRGGFTPREIAFIASGVVAPADGESSLRLHLPGADQEIAVTAGDDSQRAERYRSLESTVREGSPEEPIRARVEGTVRQDDDSWEIVLDRWEPAA